MKESDFQGFWTRSIKEYFRNTKEKYHYRKDPDMASVGGYSDKKPFDCYLFFDKRFYAFELKLQKGKNAIPFNKIAEHQYYYVDNVQACNGGFGFYIFYLLEERKIGIIKSEKMNKLKKEYEEIHNRKSVKQCDFIVNCDIIGPKKNIQKMLKKLFNVS